MERINEWRKERFMAAVRESDGMDGERNELIIFLCMKQMSKGRNMSING
jgi:hypothetical protein